LPAARAIPLRIERTSAVALNVRTSGQTPPFVLVLNESFHPEWQATLDGRVLPHVRANGFANGWVVPAGRTAQLVEVRFTAQRTYLTTVWVSLAGGLLCLGLLAWPRR
jgi:arabinofuranan 3-O-arabinosyltransferase